MPLFTRNPSASGINLPQRPDRATTLARPTGRTRLWLAAAAALVGALGCVLVQAPARWLADAVTSASGGQLQLVNARGTVWQGQAQTLFSGGNGSQDRTLLPTPLHWQLAPAWLSPHTPGMPDAANAGSGPAPGNNGQSGATTEPSTSGPALSIHLHTDCCTPAGVQLWLQPRWRGVALTLAPHQSQWPAELLSGLGTPWNTLQLQAQLALNTSAIALQLGPTGLHGQGTATLDVRDAASRLSTLRPMGSYRLTWQASAQTAPSLSLSTLQGALLLQGRGEWIAGRLRFQGDAQASPGREDALANLLNILGRRQGARSLITIG
jgi:general secretion pathway protein N